MQPKKVESSRKINGYIMFCLWNKCEHEMNTTKSEIDQHTKPTLVL
jgi:hypothetical protein